MTCDFEYDECRIDEIEPGDEILSLNEETGELEYQPVEALMDMGVKPIFKLTTREGKSIKTTGNHPYLVKAGGNLKLGVKEQRNSPFKMVKEKHLQEDYEFSDVKVIWEASAFIEEHNRKINDKHNADDNKKNHIFIHKPSPFAFLDNPDVYDQGENSAGNIKMKKRHSFVWDMLDTFIEKFKNKTVMAMPATNVNQGTLLTAPGTNIPTTSEAKTSFAASRKNSETISIQSLCSMPYKTTTQSFICQDTEWKKVISLKLGDEIAVVEPSPQPFVGWDRIAKIEYVGYEQVYDIEVEGTHNFVGNDIIAHNTFLATASGNVGIGSTPLTTSGTTGPSQALEVNGGANSKTRSLE